MRKKVQVRGPLELRNDSDAVVRRALKSAGVKGGHGRILKRSLDARQRNIHYVFQVEIWTPDDAFDDQTERQYQVAGDAHTVHIVGAGPAGYFAALECLVNGIRPIVYERGKDVRSRRRDLRAVQQFGVVDPDSNYCFGEGGAGTYSDGKLYTRATKRGNIRTVIETLVHHGADPDILIDAHPHIGSNKLPKIIQSIRETIETHGGEIHFDTRVTDIAVDSGHVRSLVLNGRTEVDVSQLILATGHSARDIYAILQENEIRTELKPFALGVRIEHPQSLIDSIQYKRKQRGELLPAASYRLACQVDDTGVYSFCMCPGGLIVPASTAPGEIVVNGMSLSRRDSAYANAGTVVEVSPSMVKRHTGGEEPAHGLEFQSLVEQRCFAAGDGSQRAPAQRLIDFANGKLSADLPETSYIPGIHSYDVGSLLPEEITHSLRRGVVQFGKRMKGYYTNDAIVVATESRTSSPVRIPRDAETLMHPEIKGLFPSGEGAGYAGGIVSAAVDGMRCARAAARAVGVEIIAS